MYNAEQLNQMITDIIGNLDNQGRVSELLQDFRTDYTGTLTDHETLTANHTKLSENYETLKNVNNKMMLQLGDVSTIVNKEKEEKQKIEEQQESEKEEPYQNLFNENGELI